MARESGRDWSPASRVEADAQGPSGQRVFRLLVETPDTSAVLAIEKEQLQFLAMLVEQILTGLPAVQVRNPDLDQADESPAGVGFPAFPDVTFRIARLSLGIDEERDVFVLMAYESEDDQEAPPTFGCLVSRSQIRRLSRQISRLVAAGRPRCPLCQTPLDGGPHHCSGSNGHVTSAETD